MILPFTPDNVQIEIFNRCDMGCPLCPTGRSEVVRKRPDISVDIFNDIISELSERNPRIQLWNYGEPLLHPDIIKIVQSIPSVFSDCSISTNGQVMSTELADTISNSGITEIIFAIDGLTQESYQKYRRRGSLEKALESIKFMTKARERLDSDIKISVQFIVFKHNFNEIPALGNFLTPLGVDEIRAKSAMLMKDGDNSSLVLVAECYLYLDYPGERYYLDNGQFYVKGSALDYCPLIENSMVITTDGRFLPCCWDYGCEFSFDGVGSWNRIKSIINSSNPPNMCDKCPVRFQHTFSWPWNKVPGVEY